LYSPKPVFCYGFLGLGILNLVISFLTDKYSFLILRAISGISAAALIPSSYRLITAVFEEDELPRAFTVYSLSGALGASFGVQIGGLVELIPNGGQMSGWRWYFRITTAVMWVIYRYSLRGNKLMRQYPSIDMVFEVRAGPTGRRGECKAQVEASRSTGIDVVSPSPRLCADLG
jgi:MFS family permease